MLQHVSELPFYGSPTLHCMYIPPVLTPHCGWTQGLLPPSGFMNDADVDMSLQASAQVLVFNSVGYTCTRGELLGHMAVLYLA